MSKQERTLRILFASRLVEEKWVDILINVIHTSMKDPILRDTIVWTICSDGPYEWEIVALMRRYPNRVYYLGKVTPDRMHELYDENDFLYMPSRFLETFGLTALESLASGTPVIGSRKWGLIPFIPEALALDQADLVDSTLSLLRKYRVSQVPQPIDVSPYSLDIWKENLTDIFASSEKILLIHDYSDLIGWAEYYIAHVTESLRSIGKTVEFYGYREKTTPWKRRWMFIIGIIAFWRWMALSKKLWDFRPDTLWMHSILRYVGPWGIASVRRYIQEYPQTRIYLSHHDVWLIAPFPQYITHEGQIPLDGSLLAFIQKELPLSLKFMSGIKWCYIQILKKMLPKETKHIIFAPFLESSIRSHFPDQTVLLFPHCVNNI